MRVTHRKKYLKIYDYICNYFQQHQRFPTHRELIDAEFYRSTSSVGYGLARLEQMGLLKREARYYLIVHANITIDNGDLENVGKG